MSGAACEAFQEELGVSVSHEFVQGYCDASALTIPDGDRTVTLIGDWNRVAVHSASTVKPILLSRDGGSQSKVSGFPAMTVRAVGKGVIAGIYGPLFDAFAYSHYPGIRRAVGELIGDGYPQVGSHNRAGLCRHDHAAKRGFPFYSLCQHQL